MFRHGQRRLGKLLGQMRIGIFAMTAIRQEILQALTELSERYPNWRFGQMVANVSSWAREPTAEAVWDVEDEEFLKGIRSHLERHAASVNGPA